MGQRLAESPKSKIDPRLIRAIGHPARVAIMERLQGRVASPTELAAELGSKVENLTYHTKVLMECDCLELVKTRQVRAVTEHFYRAKPKAFIGARHWRKLSLSVRGGITGPTLETFFDQAASAFDAGKFDEKEETTLGCTFLILDSIGWVKANELLDGFLKDVEALHEESLARLKVTGDPGTRVIIASAVFETAEAPESPVKPPT